MDIYLFVYIYLFHWLEKCSINQPLNSLLMPLPLDFSHISISLHWSSPPSDELRAFFIASSLISYPLALPLSHYISPSHSLHLHLVLSLSPSLSLYLPLNLPLLPISLSFPIYLLRSFYTFFSLSLSLTLLHLVFVSFLKNSSKPRVTVEEVASPISRLYFYYLPPTSQNFR